jgi:hypothetical protein
MLRANGGRGGKVSPDPGGRLALMSARSSGTNGTGMGVLISTRVMTSVTTRGPGC